MFMKLSSQFADRIFLVKVPVLHQFSIYHTLDFRLRGLRRGDPAPVPPPT